MGSLAAIYLLPTLVLVAGLAMAAWGSVRHD